MPTEAQSPTPSASGPVLERLAFVALIARRGLAQTQEPGPLNALGLLTLHDAVELFLQLAAEQCGITPSEKTLFHEYFPAINSKLVPDVLSGIPAMDRLNRARRNFKHAGLRPHERDLAAHRSAVESFFEENTPRVFGLQFREISLAFLIQHEGTRKALHAADTAMQEGNMQEAIQQVGIAFARFGASYGVPRSPAAVGGDLQPPLKQLVAAVAKLQHQVALLSLGVDRMQLIAFEQFAPAVILAMDMTTVQQQLSTGRTPPSPEIVRFCYDFVLDTALRLEARRAELTRILVPGSP